ncbi:MAG: hypothetical protein GF309_00625 [Candidatus Lokiarchaeota archaeon]|nr:hypothetical protein [Candidatus Lokiarchaeota archaeon]
MSDDEFPNLKTSEEIIREDSAKHVIHGGNVKQGGRLVLTNQRLLFGRESSFLFFFFKSTDTTVDVPLDQIRKVGTKGMIRKQLQVSHEDKGNYEKDFFQVGDVDEWVAKLKEVSDAE